MKCNQCGLEVKHEGTLKTLVGKVPIFKHGPFHYHDDNCYTRHYICSCGNHWVESKKVRCEVCGWIQREECFCHPGKKVSDWSDPENYVSDNFLKFYKGIEPK